MRKKGPHDRFDKATYKNRASVEQSIGWIGECRRIATRYGKLDFPFMAMIRLAFIKFYLKKYSSDTAIQKSDGPPLRYNRKRINGTGQTVFAGI